MKFKKVYLYKDTYYAKVKSGGFYACCECAFYAEDCTYLFHELLGRSIGCDRKIFKAVQLREDSTFIYKSKVFGVKEIINLGGGDGE